MGRPRLGPRQKMNTPGIRLIRRGSKKSARDAVAAGLEAVYPRLWRFALSLAGNRAAADDLAQRACERALDRADQFDPDTHLDRWILTIARRIWLNEMRAQAVRRGNGLVAVEDAALVSPEFSQEAYGKPA